MVLPQTHDFHHAKPQILYFIIVSNSIIKYSFLKRRYMTHIHNSTIIDRPVMFYLINLSLYINSLLGNIYNIKDPLPFLHNHNVICDISCDKNWLPTTSETNVKTWVPEWSASHVRMSFLQPSHQQLGKSPHHPSGPEPPQIRSRRPV